MLKRDWALVAIIYLLLAELLSLMPVPDLSLCLVRPEHDQQSADHDDKKYCPAFHVGAALAFEKTDHWLERHDKSVLGAFTIVLAISTIGLWLATNKLWRAGENQFGLLSKTLAATRDAAALAHPPLVLIKNVAIWRDNESDIKAFVPGETIRGEAWIVNLGHETIDLWRIYCGQYWITGQLPMRQPYYNEEDSRPFVDPDTDEVWQDKMRPGAIGRWRFEKEVPPDYNKELKFYVMGIVVYRDRLGIYRNTHFARRYDRTECRFIPEPNNIDYETHE